MRKIKDKERTNAGNIYCSFCRPEKVNAVYRRSGSCSHKDGYACEKHKHHIIETRSEHLTEADYQTWMKV